VVFTSSLLTQYCSVPSVTRGDTVLSGSVGPRRRRVVPREVANVILLAAAPAPFGARAGS